MSAHKHPRWTVNEIAILRSAYPGGGLAEAQEALPHRTWRSIHLKAHKLGIRCDVTQIGGGRRFALGGEALEEAIHLRETEGWSFARIGAHFGCAESSANSAIIAAQCIRQGYTPARRHRNGRLTADGMERLRWMLKKGMKAIDIQLRLAVSASCVAEQRRRYNADLKARGKALLPPPGGGTAYSGAKVPTSKKREAERLFMEGYGTLKVSEMAGVSKTVCTRIRAKLVPSLRRKGECLPGCDLDGKRHVTRDHARHIPPAMVERLRGLILDRVPVKRAASMCGMGACSAYRIRDQIKAELGDAFPAPRLPGRVRPLQREMLASQAIPTDKLWRFRKLVRVHGVAEARLLLRAEIVAERGGLSFEERLARLTDPSQIVENFKPSKLVGHDISLTGSAAGQAAEAA